MKLTNYCFLRCLQSDVFRDYFFDHLKIILRKGEDLAGLIDEFCERRQVPRVDFTNKMKSFEHEYELIEKKGWGLLDIGSDLYPKNFFNLPDPPLLLTYAGSSEQFEKKMISVVGSRSPTEESLRWLEMEYAEFLQNSDFVTVSGGARGIDLKAHSLGLRSGQGTLIFLPTGLLNPYPEFWETKWQNVIDHGGVFVSEFPLAMPIRKHHFYHRNRLIAGVSNVLFVVEAKIRSGTMMTASRAAEIGRPILCLPAGVWNSKMSGNLELLRMGAQMVTSAYDLRSYTNVEYKSISNKDTTGCV